MQRRVFHQPFFLLVMVVIVVGSLLMIFVEAPEYVRSVSSDQILRIEGFARDANEVLIETWSTQDYQYGITIEKNRTLKQAKLTVIPQDVTQKPDRIRLFDRAQNQWIEEPLQYDPQTQVYFLSRDEFVSTILQILFTP